MGILTELITEPAEQQPEQQLLRRLQDFDYSGAKEGTFSIRFSRQLCNCNSRSRLRSNRRRLERIGSAINGQLGAVAIVAEVKMAFFRLNLKKPVMVQGLC